MSTRQHTEVPPSGLLEQLLADEGFRAEFRADPARALSERGLDGLAARAEELTGARQLDARESKSSFAGLFVGLAAEGAALFELLDGPDVAAVAPAAPSPETAAPTPAPAEVAAPPAAAGPAAPAALPDDEAAERSAVFESGGEGRERREERAADARAEERPAKATAEERPAQAAAEDAVSQGAATPFAAEIDAAAARHRIDPALLRGLIRQESGFDPRATSPAGAQGLCQLMPATARGLGVDDPLDPEQSIEGGATYLRQQLDRYGGDERLALAAYNAGPGNVDKYGGVPPFEETQGYVRRVLAYAEEYRRAAPAEAAAHDAPEDPAPAGRGTGARQDEGRREDAGGGAAVVAAPASTADGERSAVFGGLEDEDGGEAAVAPASETSRRPQRREGRSVGERMVAIARRELGVEEQGVNEAPRIADYRKATVGSMPGQPWCAYFVSWVAERAGRPLGANAQGFGAVADVWSWAQSVERAVPYGSGTPRPGDLVVFSTKHIGLVEKVLPDGRIQTIEGNYSDEVARVVRSPQADGITGFVRMR
jgi:soluble lytic murein transglycosylase-like protein